jgi:lipopolysaccharide export system protein LptC
MLAKLPVDIGGLVVSGTKITMKQPRLAGYTSDQRPYELSAQAAAQDLTNTDLVELQGIRAKMEMKDKVVIESTAHSGIFQTKTEVLKLQHNIVVTSSNGYRARLAEAMVDIRANKIVSEKPVEVTTPSAIINANRMEIAESGGVIRFERGVSVTLIPEGDAIHLVSKADKP